MRTLFLCACAAGLSVVGTAPAGSPQYTVTPYASVPGPTERMSFDSTGVLYIGHDTNEQSGPIFRVPCGGGAAAPFGPEFDDPDAVVVDRTGDFSGLPGAILVGGGSGGLGYVTTLDPCTGTIYEGCTWDGMDPPTNPADLAIDSMGWLLLASFGVYETESCEAPSGGPFIPRRGDGPQVMALTPEDRVFVANSEGEIGYYERDGTEIHADYVVGLGFVTGLAVGPGGCWGEDLYAANTDGDLYRIDSGRLATLIVSGLGRVTDIAFGPDDDLYVADLAGSVARISSDAADVNGDGRVDFADLLTVLAAWGDCE